MMHMNLTIWTEYFNCKISEILECFWFHKLLIYKALQIMLGHTCAMEKANASYPSTFL